MDEPIYKLDTSYTAIGIETDKVSWKVYFNVVKIAVIMLITASIYLYTKYDLDIAAKLLPWVAVDLTFLNVVPKHCCTCKMEILFYVDRVVFHQFRNQHTYCYATEDFIEIPYTTLTRCIYNSYQECYRFVGDYRWKSYRYKWSKKDATIKFPHKDTAGMVWILSVKGLDTSEMSEALKCYLPCEVIKK